MVDSDLTNEEIDSLLEDLDSPKIKGNDSSKKENIKTIDFDKMEDLGKDTTKANLSEDDKQVKKIKFSELTDDSENLVPSNMKMLLEVPMDITVELGRTKRKVKDILSLNVGSVIELNKLSGEPLELLVNGRIIALAEVVVIDENFGVRITEIIDPENRIKFE